MADLATPFDTALERVASQLIDSIAIDGLEALQAVLDEEFADSKYLKDYELLAHVSSEYIIFEILVNLDAVELETEQQAEYDRLRKETEREAKKELQKDVLRTYRLDRKKRGVVRDARTPARDARTTARDRLMKTEIRNTRPRGANVTDEGKLSIRLKRSFRQIKNEVKLPEKGTDGIIKKMIERLAIIITDKYVPKLTRIMSDYVL